MNKPKKVICPREGCQGIVAYIYGDRLSSVKRTKQLHEIVGKDYVLVTTCPFKDCLTRTTIVCQDGKIRLDNLQFKEEEEENKTEDKEDDKKKKE